MRDPHGVMAICSPWNYPVDEILLLALPALAAGNAVVVKPSEVAPLCGARSVGALARALPEGLVGLLQGDGGVGKKLVEHADVDLVGMTGSTATGPPPLTPPLAALAALCPHTAVPILQCGSAGAMVMRSAAVGLKRIILELGGKDPMVVSYL